MLARLESVGDRAKTPRPLGKGAPARRMSTAQLTPVRSDRPCFRSPRGRSTSAPSTSGSTRCARAPAATFRTGTATTRASTTRIVTTPANARDLPLALRRLDRARQADVAPARAAAPGLRFEEHAFNEPWSDGEHRLTLFPAGHVLGSAQLMIEGERGRFVYTGDFKLARSYTCEPPEVKRVRRAADGVHVRPPAVRVPVARRGRGRDRRVRDEGARRRLRAGLLRVLARQGARGDGDPRQSGRSR